MAAVFELDNKAQTATFRARRARTPRSPEVRAPRSPEVRAPRSPEAGRADSGAPSAATVALLGVAMVAILLVVLAAGSRMLSYVAAQPVEPSGEYHVVSEGDTLYSVAQSWDPDTPTPVVIEQIRSLNSSAEPVAVGEVLALPRAVR